MSEEFIEKMVSKYQADVTALDEQIARLEAQRKELLGRTSLRDVLQRLLEMKLSEEAIEAAVAVQFGAPKRVRIQCTSDIEDAVLGAFPEGETAFKDLVGKVGLSEGVVRKAVQGLLKRGRLG